MKTLIAIALMLLAGCAGTDEYRVNSLKPQPNRIACPTGSVVILEQRGGGRMKMRHSDERWSCVDEDEIELMRDHELYEDDI